MSSTVPTEARMLSNFFDVFLVINSLFSLTWSIAGSQATPVRPRPGLPVGEIEVPRVTRGEDLEDSGFYIG